ncbi:hypothetical protein DUNSADRAFT_16613 [Dunaliella salina]|uniref:Encoded protein n=1 Tax=Dunaliella salina TaxID=3046 RepID=A0ABQ7G399_DUNSA|nr:hypothetical protein DUNSADRAFT_16613 [Dunaliella salina]|eukprot:KAF5829081.1 hypothetical protein DUNSADRAFT_16613 [Dunaliella salina]
MWWLLASELECVSAQMRGMDNNSTFQAPITGHLLGSTSPTVTRPHYC